MGLVYGSFRYTKDTHDAKLDPLARAVGERQENGHIPVWADVGSIVIGGALLLVPDTVIFLP
jgi:hypothetical protein